MPLKGGKTMTHHVSVDARLEPAGTSSTMRRWWIMALPLLLINLIAQTDKICVSVVISNKQFLRDLNLVGKPAIAGLLMSGFLVSYAVFHFFWAYWIKKYGPRASAILGICVWALSLLLSAVAQSATHLIAARVILGMGGAMTYPICNAFVANWFPVRERSRASSIWMSGSMLGGIVSGILIVALMVYGGWRLAFFGLFVLNLLVPLPALIFLMRNQPREQKLISHAEVELIEAGSLEHTKEVPKAQVKGYLRNYRFWMIAIAWGFSNIYWWGWSTWMPTYFQLARHFSFKSAGYIYSLNFMFSLLAAFIVGYFSDRTMRRAPFGGVGWVLAGILLMVGGLSIENPYWAVTVLVISGCCYYPAFVMCQSLLHSIIKETSMGSAVAISGGLSQFIGMVSPTLIGFLIGISRFDIAIVCLGMGLIVPGVMILFLAKQGY